MLVYVNPVFLSEEILLNVCENWILIAVYNGKGLTAVLLNGICKWYLSEDIYIYTHRTVGVLLKWENYLLFNFCWFLSRTHLLTLKVMCIFVCLAWILHYSNVFHYKIIFLGGEIKIPHGFCMILHRYIYTCSHNSTFRGEAFFCRDKTEGTKTWKSLQTDENTDGFQWRIYCRAL